VQASVEERRDDRVRRISKIAELEFECASRAGLVAAREAWLQCPALKDALATGTAGACESGDVESRLRAGKSGKEGQGDGGGTHVEEEGVVLK